LPEGIALNIVFAGTPVFSSIALNALLNRAINVVAVYTQPDRPAGRGMKLTASPVKTLALSHHIPVFQPASLKSPEAQAELAALKPDLMIVAAYGLILPQAVLDIPRLGCLNIHASLLPRWRGAAPIQRAILAGDSESGVCIMQMEAGLDTGPVLLEKRCAIARGDTAGDLHDQLAELGASAIVEVVERLAAADSEANSPAPLVALAQPSEGVTYASKISPEEAQIDWSQSAEAIERAVNAFNPVPGAWTHWRSEKLKIWRANALTTNEVSASQALSEAMLSAKPGEIVRSDGRLCVRCGDAESDKKSVLAITEIQRAGAKRIPIAAWLGTAVSPQSGELFASNPRP
jgi:methionyl-tRNA formyltransferase